MTSDVSLPDLGRRLCSARLQRGLSQGTVARLSGVAPSYLSRIENGRIQPSFRTVMRVCHALHGELVEIIGPESSGSRRGHCPVSSHGRCMLELIRSEADLARRAAPDEVYTPRQIRLLRRLAEWMRAVGPDRLRAMEVLLEDLTRGRKPGPASNAAS